MIRLYSSRVVADRVPCRLAHSPAFHLILLIAFLVGTHGVVSADHRSYGYDLGNPGCWYSRHALAAHRAYFQITGSVPTTWHSWLTNAAATWSNVSTSSFRLDRVSSSSNQIRVANLGQGPKATTSYSRNGETMIAPNITTFNSYYRHGPFDGYDYHPQNTMTHEFGHLINLGDEYTAGCEDTTMWWDTAGVDENKKITLHFQDIEGVTWQYP